MRLRGVWCCVKNVYGKSGIKWQERSLHGGSSFIVNLTTAKSMLREPKRREAMAGYCVLFRQLFTHIPTLYYRTTLFFLCVCDRVHVCAGCRSPRFPSGVSLTFKVPWTELCLQLERAHKVAECGTALQTLFTKPLLTWAELKNHRPCSNLYTHLRTHTSAHTHSQTQESKSNQTRENVQTFLCLAWPDFLTSRYLWCLCYFYQLFHFLFIFSIWITIYHFFFMCRTF